MTLRSILPILSAGLGLLLAGSAGAQSRERGRPAPGMAERAAAGAYQGRDRGPDATERFSRTVRVPKDGRLSVENIAGTIKVTGEASTDEIVIEAVKHARGDRSQLEGVDIDVQEHGGRVDVETVHVGRNVRVWVDYTISVPASIGVELRSISGDIEVRGVQGSVRGEAVSGDVTMDGAPNVESAKSVSGDVSLAGVSTLGDLAAGSSSGSLTLRGVKARALELASISGDLVLSDIICDRVAAKTISGTVEFGGRILRDGRYEFNAHSGDVRLRLQNPGGFEVNANTFSGSIRSDLSLVIHSEGRRGSDRRGRDERQRSMQATYGDGSALVLIRTFSGDIVLTER
ncbi:MAG: DUF4097 family beta strand repeat protein [Acidobacteria bacterium]|nr:DUF4097 family beta strand repeat protein [Acidobacteriota bacterium]